MFPIEKYKFYITENKVIAVSSYAGKRVRGVATCHPDDEFDVNLGKKIAALRCAKKIALKRLDRATVQSKKANTICYAAKRKVATMEKYHADALEQVLEIENELSKMSIK